MPAPPLDEIARRIVQAFHPERIVLFGSRARGDAGSDSDVDLMVEMNTDATPAERSLAVQALFGLRDWSLDVVVLTPAEMTAARGVTGTLVSMIDAEGRVIYQRDQCAA